MCNCFSAAPENAATPPNKRVNYVSGMVLGKEDFFQEQRHFEWKSRLANHLPHGYGILCGLDVPQPALGDFQIRIQPGYAISPKGNWLWVEEELCAPLDKWLTDNLKDLADKTDGVKSVFVRLCYKECETDAVPIAVNACASSEDSTAPSRILETVSADFAWAAPILPEFPATHAEAVALSLLSDTVSVHNEMGLWATTKRNLAANGGCLPDDNREDCLLLATVTFALTAGALDTTVALIVSQTDVPTLMDTVLLQEWLAELQATALKKNEAAGGDLTGFYPDPTIRPAAVTNVKIADLAITDAKVNDVDWSKITNKPVSFPPNGTAGGDLGDAYPDPRVVGLQKRAVADKDPNDKQVLTWDDGAKNWLPADAQAAPIDINLIINEVTTQVVTQINKVPVLPFATISLQPAPQNAEVVVFPSFRIWFHLTKGANNEWQIIFQEGSTPLTVFGETNAPATIPAFMRNLNLPQPISLSRNVGSIPLNAVQEKNLARTPLLRFVFDLTVLNAEKADGTRIPLIQMINDGLVRWEGFDGNRNVTVYFDLQAVGRRG